MESPAFLLEQVQLNWFFGFTLHETESYLEPLFTVVVW